MTTNTPDFIVYGVTSRDKGRKDILTRIGGAWKHQKGDGINLQVQALPLNFEGKIVLFPPKSRRGGRSSGRRRDAVLAQAQAARPSGRAAKPFQPSCRRSAYVQAQDLPHRLSSTIALASPAYRTVGSRVPAGAGSVFALRCRSPKKH